MKVNHLNKKLMDAVEEKENVVIQCEDVIKKHFPGAFRNIMQLNEKIFSSPTIEYPDNFFTIDNLYNTNYHDVNYHDYEKFFYLCHLYGLNGGTGKVLNDVMKGQARPPVLIKGTNNKFWLFSGNVEMMSYKVIGLFPLVTQIDVEVEVKI